MLATAIAQEEEKEGFGLKSGWLEKRRYELREEGNGGRGVWRLDRSYNIA